MNCCKKRTFTGIIFIAVSLIAILFYPLKASAAEDYYKWRQNDSRWGSILLGDSTQTMAQSGCLVTSIAILAVHSGAEDADSFNPGTFVTALNSINAFSGGAIASWSKITEVVPDVQFVKKYTFTSSTQSGKAAEMKAINDEGYYMVCNVGNHWVFIESIDGSNVYMIDPAKDDTDLFSSYSLSSITELRVFSGKNAPQSSTTQTTTAATTTSTTTITVTTTTTTTTTTATTTNSSKYKTGEYYASAKTVSIYSSASTNSSVIETVQKGYIVKITSFSGSMGCVQLGAEKGWISMSDLTYAGTQATLTKGDINDDGSVDKLDLALLNEYLSSLSELPDGISYLLESEIEAADLNNDGVVDNNDVLKYLSIICN